MEISLSPQVTLKEVDQGAILVDRQGEATYALDAMGVRLWQLLSANGDFDAAVTHLLVEYEVDDEADEVELRRELLELLEDMAQVDLVAWG
jgi:hypothetical protein